MARYSRESRDRVRDAVDFVDLVSARTELRRAGARRLQGLCPFHEERTPSFGIDPVEKLYHCFGCGASGDVFTFVMETEGLDFPGALEALADRYHVPLEREDEDPRQAERRRRRERLLELLDRTATWYSRVLWESAEAARAREYLTSRGLDEATLREFRVGYAPSAWDRALTASRRAGFSEEELLAAGLVQRSRGRASVYDRFRARIMFPLTDARGRVRGFGARATRDNQQPKYLNSPDGELFHKGHQLFAVDLARAAAARESRVVLAEGYTDVIALHQAGIRHAVGLMGTALTEDQVGELARLAPTVVLCLDADSAGQEAMLRAAALMGARSLEPRVVPLPAGSDPAEIAARDGAERIRELVERAVPLSRFAVERALAGGDLSSAEGRDRVLAQVAETLRGLPPSALREELVRLVADRLQLSEALTAAVLGPEATPAGPGAVPDRAGTARASVRRALDRREQTERSFLALCLALPDQGARFLAEGDVEQSLSSPLVRRAAAYLRGHLHEPAAGLPEGDPELAALVAELVVRAREAGADPRALEVERLQLELARLDREIATARVAEAAEVGQLAARRQEVLTRIRQLLT